AGSALAPAPRRRRPGGTASGATAGRRERPASTASIDRIAADIPAHHAYSNPSEPGRQGAIAMTESTTDLPPVQLPAGLGEETLKQLGLVPADLEQVTAIHAGLADLSPTDTQGYGRDVAAATTRFSSELLDQV